MISRLGKTAVCASLCLLLAACSGPARKVRFEGIGDFDRHGWAGADVTLNVANGSAHRVSATEARVVFYYRGAFVGEAKLMGRAAAAKHAVSSVPTRWKFRVNDPAAAYMLLKRIEERRYEGISLDVQARVRLGWAARRISFEGIPLSDFIRTFGEPEHLN